MAHALEHEMTAIKPDRCVERTRQLLQRALITLMIERGYHEVTIQNILECAGIGRSTFYAHFRDKEALLESTIENMRDGLTHQWKSALANEGGSPGRLAFVLPFFRHVDSNRAIWKIIIRDEAGRIVDRQFREMLGGLVRKDLAMLPKPGVSPATMNVIVPFVVGGLMSVLADWMEDRVHLTPEEVNQEFL